MTISKSTGNISHLSKSKKIEGHYISMDGETFFVIENYDEMPPFFMTIVSPQDHWLFIASNGGLTAGRKNANAALFPYYTDDKIVDLAPITGSKTTLKVKRDGYLFVWEPFTDRSSEQFRCDRNIYKNTPGNKILFEEINIDLGITYRYMWTFSEKFGFIKKSTLINDLDIEIVIECLDGIQNILPYGVNSDLQSNRSTLVDAYKKNELDVETGVGIFSLSAMIVDKAEASEALSATTVWSVGFNTTQHLLSSQQLLNYRRNKFIQPETDLKAVKGAYFVKGTVVISAKSSADWFIVSEVNQSHTNLNNLRKILKTNTNLLAEIEQDIAKGTRDLTKLVSKADGLQHTNDPLSAGRHFTNVLFNIMRGGIFDNQYTIEAKDLVHFLTNLNKQVVLRNRDFITQLPEIIQQENLIEIASKTGDTDLERLCNEYLPLYFSRRHGDPSRPWNYFSIETQNEEGERVRYYEGNWRDIFQNWEALAFSFPNYIESFIAKFVNASTIDGYNPYRVGKFGIDWEVVDEHDPWSYIGYWGDHQVIYLLKLLELSKNHHPQRIQTWLTKPMFVYANVPYRIKPYKNIVANPRDTIDFDNDLETLISHRVEQVGGDGKLVWDKSDKPLRANLSEKLLVSICTKLYNFIPEAGIWLNTQRPEWNDANNALVGNGVSMVTLYYLRRYLTFCIELFGHLEHSTVSLNTPVSQLVLSLSEAFSSNLNALKKPSNDIERRQIIDKLGKIGEKYRTEAYAGFKGIEDIKTIDISHLLKMALEVTDATIKCNKRADGLYHSYNLLELTDNKAEITSLYEMLEGQVAVLSSGFIKANEASELLDALKSSKMFRPDQFSYMLYPDRVLPTFLEKNIIPESNAYQSALIQALVREGNTKLVERDNQGGYHFNGNLHNVQDVHQALIELKRTSLNNLVEDEYKSIVDLFEQVFQHKSFTGRSGTFYGYEGLGCIYWHMVSKLLLATQENIFIAHQTGASNKIIGNLMDHYYEIRAGIGVNKSPEVYGAFPTDAYSHTPGNAGAQQPGMTGQVKEDIINRWAELGLVVKDGCISFDPIILRSSEYLNQSGPFKYVNVQEQWTSIDVPVNSLAFTYCQVPFVYTEGKSAQIEIHFMDKSIQMVDGASLSTDISKQIFTRSGKVSQVTVHLFKN